MKKSNGEIMQLSLSKFDFLGKIIAIEKDPSCQKC